jgi:hypothetical protein
MPMMHTIPMTILDNFLDDPDKIRAWALQQQYFPAEDGRWPGLRSKPIHELDTPFFHLVCRKFFSQFYDVPNMKELSWDVSMNFQMVSKDYDSGWIHSDEEFSQITGIIYLSPNANLNGGTSIYRNKSNLVQPIHVNTNFKKDSYLKKIPIQEAKKNKEDHNWQYEETIRVSNVYNRLISFDSHMIHAAQDFFGEGEESRLTLVFFVQKLLVNNTPIGRVRRMVTYD